MLPQKKIVRRRNWLASLICLAFIGFFLPSDLLAQFLYSPNMVNYGNRWEITGFDDSTTTHAQYGTQGLCFRFIGNQGTHMVYEWWSDTFTDWNGMARQEGDHVRMHGDYANDVGHDGMDLQLVTNVKGDEGFGHWTEWREDGGYGNTIGFANAKIVRVGKCEENADKSLNFEMEFYPEEELGKGPMFK